MSKKNSQISGEIKLLPKPLEEKKIGRRQFIENTTKVAGGIAIGALSLREFLHPVYANPSVEVGKIWINIEETEGMINKYIYGLFSEHLGRCIYEGVWVGEDSFIPNDGGIRMDSINALKKIHAPVVRWPGGCFADAYHWEDGIGPRDQRPPRWNIWWNQPESNHFGTDEFLRFCRLVGCEPYLCLNVGSGSPQEAFNWVEYCNSNKDTYYTRLRAKNGHPEPYNVKFWAVGNESWGCGGRYDGDSYAEEYLHYATYLQTSYTPNLKLVACGWERGDYNQKFFERMKDALRRLDYLSIHYYYGRREEQATDFSDEQYYELMLDVENLNQLFKETVGLIDYYTQGEKKIGIIFDEWGTWYKVEPGFPPRSLYQQNTLRDAISAASTLNLLNHWCNNVVMANIAQTFNVLQAIAFTREAEMILTPTYHIFNMYQNHQDGKLLHTIIETPEYSVTISPPGAINETRSREAVNISASLNEIRKEVCLTAVNEDLSRDMEFDVELLGGKARNIECIQLTSTNVRNHNTFDNPEKLKPTSVSVRERGNRLRIELPAHSVSKFIIQLGF